MHEQILSTLGLALRAGRLEAGEEPVGSACRGHIARLIVVAADAAPNTFRRAQHFGDSWNVMVLAVPFRKDELGWALGRSSCAIAAVTDPGFAASIVEKLAQIDPIRYASAALELAQRLAAPGRHHPPAPPPPPPGHRPPPGPGPKPGPRPGPAPKPGPKPAPAPKPVPPKPKTPSKPGAASKPKTPPGPKPGSPRGGRGGGFGPGPRR